MSLDFIMNIDQLHLIETGENCLFRNDYSLDLEWFDDEKWKIVAITIQTDFIFFWYENETRWKILYLSYLLIIGSCNFNPCI